MSLVREFNLVRKRLSKDNNDEGRKALNKEKSLKDETCSIDDHVISRWDTYKQMVQRGWNKSGAKARRLREGCSIYYHAFIIILPIGAKKKSNNK